MLVGTVGKTVNSECMCIGYCLRMSADVTVPCQTHQALQLTVSWAFWPAVCLCGTCAFVVLLMTFGTGDWVHRLEVSLSLSLPLSCSLSLSLLFSLPPVLPLSLPPVLPLSVPLSLPLTLWLSALSLAFSHSRLSALSLSLSLSLFIYSICMYIYIYIYIHSLILGMLACWASCWISCSLCPQAVCKSLPHHK